MKKVLIISPGYVPIVENRGGAIENLLKLYLDHNEKTRNYEITVYEALSSSGDVSSKAKFKTTEIRNIDVSNHENELRHKVSRVANILFGTSCARFYIKEVIRDLKTRHEFDKYDLIIIENCVNDLVYIEKFLKTTTPIVLHLHNDYLDKSRMDAKKIVRFLKEVWCVSNYIRDRVNAISPYDGKAITIYNAIDTSDFNTRMGKNEKNRLREKLDFGRDDCVYLYVGRIMRGKGVLTLVKAFHKLNVIKPDSKLLVIGGRKKGIRNNRYYNAVLCKMRSNKNIVYLGQVKNSELYKYYQISDYQIIPSKCQEAFGLVALEGKVSGLKIISTGNGGLREVLDKNDILIDKLSVNSLVKAMLTAPKLPCDSEPLRCAFSEERYNADIDSRIGKLVAQRKEVE